MKQLNLYITKEFEHQLKVYMKIKQVKKKSEAIRLALREAMATIEGQKKRTDFLSWLGIGLKVSPRRTPKFQSEDDLWS